MTVESRPSLSERKRQQARSRIVRAAEELFAERGFTAVSAADIAERAEVGRTTFFRYFGDKQEVVFAQEQELAATIAQGHAEPGGPAPEDLRAALIQLRTVVLGMCGQVTQDADRYTRHYELVERHPELVARDALKMRQFADGLAAILVARGASDANARLAAELALGCFQAGKARHGNDPARLAADVDWAFEHILDRR